MPVKFSTNLSIQFIKYFQRKFIVTGLKEDFRFHLDEFCFQIFQPDFLTTKKVGGVELKGEDVLKYLHQCHELLESRNISVPLTTIEVSWRVFCLLSNNNPWQHNYYRFQSTSICSTGKSTDHSPEHNSFVGGRIWTTNDPGGLISANCLDYKFTSVNIYTRRMFS